MRRKRIFSKGEATRLRGLLSMFNPIVVPGGKKDSSGWVKRRVHQKGKA